MKVRRGHRFWIEPIHHSGLHKVEVPGGSRAKPEASNGEASTTTPRTRKPRKAQASTSGRGRQSETEEKPAAPEAPAPDPAENGTPIPGTVELQTPQDPESDALATCAQVLLPLEEIEQVRVLDYLAHRFVSEERRAELRAGS